MDRLVKFVGNGPAIIINPKYVTRIEEVEYPRAPLKRITRIYTAHGNGATYEVAGTPEQVAEALGYQLVTFDPATGISEASEGAS